MYDLCCNFVYSGMEERLCRMPEFKYINQIKANQSVLKLVTYGQPNLRPINTAITAHVPMAVVALLSFRCSRLYCGWYC